MSNGYYWDEALPELIPEVDWSAVKDWEALGKVLDEHVSTAREFMPPTPSGQEIYALNHRAELDALRAENARLNTNIDQYRLSVARRRGVPIQDVHIENGAVVYGKAFCSRRDGDSG